MSCITMCLSSGHTSDERDRSSLTNGLRSKLPQLSGHKRDRVLSSSRIPSSHASVKTPRKETKAMTLAAQDPRSRTAVTRQGSPAEFNSKKTVEAPPISNSSKDPSAQLRLSPLRSRSEGSRPDKKAMLSSVSKIKTRQMKGLITGMGKELRRAATTVGERLPNPNKKKNGERERKELMGVEPPTPQARNIDEIKKAYGHPAGHPADVREAASMTHAKLHERGEKLSALQRRTTEMEADAANFDSLTQELVKKFENKKWFEL